MTRPCHFHPMPAQHGAAADQVRFLRSWLRNPLQIAAVAPSGEALAALMTREITVASAPVIELGPGTGVFTKALVEKQVAEADLTLVEFSEAFVTILRDRYPAARIVHGDATRLRFMRLFDERKAGAVVSGLGLLSMSPRAVIAILSGAFTVLRPDGAFYQFTYAPRCPVPDAILDRLDLEATKIGGTWRNLPPAAVYRIRRRRS